jgi:hypothetical protein
MQGKSMTWLPVALVAACAAASAITAKAAVTYDALPGSGTLTSNGWTNLQRSLGDANTVPPKGKDYSVSQSDAGTNGIWHINDDNSNTPAGNSYMWMVRDPQLDGYGLTSSTGLVMARIKAVGGTTTNGSFGYSVGFGSNSFSGVLGIRAGVVKFADANGSSASQANLSMDTTSDYRVYAIRWATGGGSFDAWVSNGNSWSVNPGDWTQIGTGVTVAGMTALLGSPTDNPNPVTKNNGLVVGSMGSSGNTSDIKLDWLFYNKNDVDGNGFLQPWDVNPVPEPTTLLLLAAGLTMSIRRSKHAA